MQISALGGIGTAGGIGAAAWADLISPGPSAAASLGQLAAGTNATTSFGQLLGALAASGLPASAQVSISEAAKTLLAMDRDSNGLSFGELAQALIVALILQLLDDEDRKS
jgi:hypothetical protein